MLCLLKEKHSKSSVDKNLKAKNSNQNPSNVLKVEEKCLNLIAAKLMSENIELAKAPYTDEVNILEFLFLKNFKILIFCQKFKVWLL